MIGSTTGGLDAYDVPELPDTVWMRMLANALDPDTAPVDPGLVPADDGTGSGDDGSDVSDDAPADGVLSDDSADPAADTPDITDDAAAPDDGGAHLLPHPDAFPAHDPAGAGPGGSPLPPGGPPWSDPHDDHGF